jgi:hypothetical protein
MKQLVIILLLTGGSIALFSQTEDSLQNQYKNTAENMLQMDSKLLIGGYGEVHYNQRFEPNTYYNGDLDVHRMVMLFGYNFSNKTQFVTELEFEHVKEVYVEQAFLQHKLNPFMNFRAGLLLVPMGIINEYHEPNAFNGVERPLTDKYIAPTTWREIGFGISGNILQASIKYQAYLMNGFNGFDGSGNLSGKYGLRKGRQKGAESFATSPSFTGKIEYYGIRGLNLGVSTYLGKTQSTLYNGINKNDVETIATADSSIVHVKMLGLDARYNYRGLALRGQLYYIGLENTAQYNLFTSSTDGTPNDLGNAMLGYYLEIGYNVLSHAKTDMQLSPFFRYGFYDTHNSVESSINKNLAYQVTTITTGLSFELSRGAVIKSDIQLLKNAASNRYTKTINAGIGVMF